MRLARAVLEHLRGLKSLTNKLQCELAQGYAECLRRRGFGVALHVTDGASVREQILQLARKRFDAVKRRSGLKRARFKASTLAAVLSRVKDYASDDDGDDGSATPSNLVRQRRLLASGSGSSRAPRRRQAATSGSGSSESSSTWSDLQLCRQT